MLILRDEPVYAGMVDTWSPVQQRIVAAVVDAEADRLGYTVRDMAARLGLSPATFNRLENGKRPASVAEVAGCGVIFGWDRSRRDWMEEMVQVQGRELPESTRRDEVLKIIEAITARTVHVAPWWLPEAFRTAAYQARMSGKVPAASSEEWLPVRWGSPGTLFVHQRVLESARFPEPVLAEQRRHLALLVDRRGLMVRIVPERDRGFGEDEAFRLLSLAKGQTVACLDHRTVTFILDHPDDVGFYEGVVADLTRDAYDAHKSYELLTRRVFTT